MAALRRGVAHYAEGDEDTATYDPMSGARLSVRAAPVATAPVPVANDFRTWLGTAMGMRGREAQQQITGGGAPAPAPVPVATAPAPAPAPAPDASTGFGFGQMMRGEYTRAQENPSASPATKAMSGALDRLDKSDRAAALAKPPMWDEKLLNMFFGDDASTKALEQRDQTARVLGHPLIQQHLVNNPDHLARAEQEPHVYAANAQTPEFRKAIETAVANNTAADAHPKVTDPDERQKVVDTANKHGVPVDAAHLAVAPQKYTRDEFVRAVQGMPMQAVQLLFGAQLAHIQTPQEKAANEVLDRLHGVHASATKKINDMLAEEEDRKEKKLLPKNTVKPFWGPSPLDAAKAEQAAALKDIMDTMRSFTGMSTKGVSVPPKD